MKHSKILQRILANKNFIDSNESVDELITNYLDHLVSCGKIKLENIAKDKSFVEKRKIHIQNLRNDYVEYLLDEGQESLKPKTKEKSNFVGIELECFTRYDRMELMDRITEMGLEKIVQADNDGSIDADFGEDCELRILLPEKQLNSGLKKISKLMKKGQFGVNNTCGLHIHLDMRNRDVEECYKRLMKFQDVLFGMVKKERRSNSYCKFATGENKYDRYVAINKEMAYSQHKTIEIRLHHATLDLKEVEKWVRLLLSVINTKTPPPKENKAEVLKWGKKQKGLGTYISKNFDERWFTEKKQRVAGMGGDWD